MNELRFDNPREGELVALWRTGLSADEIADKMGITRLGVQSWVAHLRQKGVALEKRKPGRMGPRGPRRSDDEKLAALRRYAAIIGASPSSAQVEKDGRAIDWLPVRTSFAKFGKWDEVLEAAGLPPVGEPLKREAA